MFSRIAPCDLTQLMILLPRVKPASKSVSYIDLADELL